MYGQRAVRTPPLGDTLECRIGRWRWQPVYPLDGLPEKRVLPGKEVRSLELPQHELVGRERPNPALLGERLDHLVVGQARDALEVEAPRMDGFGQSAHVGLAAWREAEAVQFARLERQDALGRDGLRREPSAEIGDDTEGHTFRDLLRDDAVDECGEMVVSCGLEASVKIERADGINQFAHHRVGLAQVLDGLLLGGHGAPRVLRLGLGQSIQNFGALTIPTSTPLMSRTLETV